MVARQKKQIIILSKQNKDLKNKLNNRYSKYKNLNVKYKLPEYKNGITNKPCNLYISPINDSIILTKLNENTKLDIQDSAEILDTLWYEINIETEDADRINTKGWLPEDCITKVQLDENHENKDDTNET
jgi:hypothetical protein